MNDVGCEQTLILVLSGELVTHVAELGGGEGEEGKNKTNAEWKKKNEKEEQKGKEVE